MAVSQLMQTPVNILSQRWRATLGPHWRDKDLAASAEQMGQCPRTPLKPLVPASHVVRDVIIYSVDDIVAVCSNTISEHCVLCRKLD